MCFCSRHPLYQLRDLYSEDDGEWLAANQPPERWSAALAAGFAGWLSALASQDSFVLLGPAAAHVLVTKDAVESTARMLIGQPR